MATHALSPTAVRDRLQAVGMDLGHYANPLAAIHTVLKRLVESGEAQAAEADEANRSVYQFSPRGLSERPVVRSAVLPRGTPKRPTGRRATRARS